MSFTYMFVLFIHCFKMFFGCLNCFLWFFSVGTAERKDNLIVCPDQLMYIVLIRTWTIQPVAISAHKNFKKAATSYKKLQKTQNMHFALDSKALLHASGSF